MGRYSVFRPGVIWTIFLVGESVHAGGRPAQFVPLGDLPGGGFASYAGDISADGSIVVGTGTNGIPSVSLPGGFEFEAFRWTQASGPQGLGTGLGVRGTAGVAVSGDGSMIAGSIFDEYPNRSVFTWTAAAGMTRLTGCNCVGFDSVEEVSYDGSVVVGRMSFANGFRAYRWTQATGATDLGVLPGGQESAAFDVTRDGSVVVGHSQTDRYFQAFRWTEQDGMTALADDARFGSAANAISPDGSFVVGRLGNEAVRWTISDTGVSAVPLGDLPGGGFASNAAALSSDASVMAGSGTTVHGSEAFRWTEVAGMQSIQHILSRLGVDMTGWQLYWVDAISADGSTFTGMGRNPDGNPEAYLAVIPPSYVPEAPADIAMLMGIAFMLVMRRPWAGST